MEDTETSPPSSSSSLITTVEAVINKNDPMELSRQMVANAKDDASGRVYRVYCDGVFDLFHVGHALMFKQAKFSLGDPNKVHLIAGVCNDEITMKYKGKTILDHETRCISVENCKWVDEVVPNAPWVITQEFIDEHKIDFVAHDAIPYVDTTGQSANSNDVYDFVKKKGMFLETKRTEGISTSDILLKIVQNYDSYVARNLSRGYTPEQLNLGIAWKAKAAEMKRRDEVKKAIVNVQHTSSFWGWCKAVWKLVGNAASYVNIITYLPPKQRTGVIVAIALTVCTFVVKVVMARRRRAYYNALLARLNSIHV